MRLIKQRQANAVDLRTEYVHIAFVFHGFISSGQGHVAGSSEDGKQRNFGLIKDSAFPERAMLLENS
jgi:hypothetical protein